MSALVVKKETSKVMQLGVKRMKWMGIVVHNHCVRQCNFIHQFVTHT